MKRLICSGCGLGEDLENPTGEIHRVQLVDLTKNWELHNAPDETVEEDLCRSCRDKLRHQFFGLVEVELLEMPVMKGA